MSFTIHVKLLSDEVITRDIDIEKTTLKTLKSTFDMKEKYFDLVLAGEIITDAKQLFPDAEVEVCPTDWFEVRKSIAFTGTAYWEYGSACSDKSKEKYYSCEFPAPKDVSINMMPFVFDEKESLPEEYHQYWPMIEKYGNDVSSSGSICYLTIQESMVLANTSQRRPGLHIETPGCVDNLPPKFRLGMGQNSVLHWGNVYMEMHCKGGIIMASTEPESCKLYNVRIKNKRLTEKGFIGPHGDVSHMKSLIEKGCQLRDEYFSEHYEDEGEFGWNGEKWNTWRNPNITTMKANTMYWITDRTPHESLPLKEDTYRQYFRMVTEDISVWFADHSTANPLGTVPPSDVTILRGNKFDNISESIQMQKQSDEEWYDSD